MISAGAEESEVKLYRDNTGFAPELNNLFSEATLEDLRKAADELGYALIPADERLREKQADEAIAEMIRLSKRIENSDWYKEEGLRK